ncbi:hypothetical protein [Streptomyces sp. NPDC014805]|uniref:hypothetical protein n=1 Tax=Streptomyces sp. NPDC014805 TaxID=3364919 RepID=UPI0036FAE28B
MRAVVIPGLAVALAVPLVFAPPARAAASTGTVGRSGGTVTFVPVPGTNSRVTFYVANDNVRLRVSDPGGITAGAGCTQTSATTATCGTVAGVTGLHADGGDGDDRLAVEYLLAIPADFDGGPGQDILVGGNAADHLQDPDGWPAPPVRATFRGSGGDDVIVSRNGGYDRVECENGNDTVTADPAALDRVTATCETVDRG